MTPRLTRRKLSPGHAHTKSVATRDPGRGDRYRGLVCDIETLLAHARRTSARAVNAVMTAS